MSRIGSTRLSSLRIAGDGTLAFPNGITSENDTITVQRSGDTTPRLRITNGGSLYWSSGSGNSDVRMSRVAANHLRLYDKFEIYEDKIHVIGENSSSVVYGAYIDGDSEDRFRVLSTGQISWGPGDDINDVVLRRRSSTILETTGRLEVGTLGVGNSANATTPGSCQKKIEVFDDAGNSIGFLAVYDAIT